MYFSSLLTCLSFYHLDIDYVQKFHRCFISRSSLGWLTAAGWLGSCRGWLAACIAAGHGIYEMYTFIYSKN
jgi:hypothetical protein